MADEPNWRDGLSDEMKGNESLSSFEDVGALAQGFIDAKAYQGSSVRIPGEDAGEDDIKAFNDKMIEKMPTLMYKPNLDDQEQSPEFYRTLGMPEKSDGYTLPEVEVPEGVELQSEKLEGFKEIAHKHGLTAAQFKGVMADVMAGDVAGAVAGQEATASNLTAIKEGWGHAYDDNMKKVGTLLSKTNAPEDLLKAVQSGAMDKSVVDWLYSMGKQMGGEGFNFDESDESQRREAAMTPQDAQNAIDEINNNPEHAYWKGVGLEKKRAMDHMVKLMQYANPKAGTEMLRAGSGG